MCCCDVATKCWVAQPLNREGLYRRGKRLSGEVWMGKIRVFWNCQDGLSDVSIMRMLCVDRHDLSTEK